MAHRSSHRRAPGQSIVEFALILPIMLFLFVGIVDLGRIYTTMLSVESAAREAADYGTFGSQKWSPAVVTATDGTLDQMEQRACVAAGDLADYQGPDANCVNPTFAYCLSPDQGATCGPWDAAMGCDNATREPPCRVSVTMSYTFNLLVPLGFEVFGVRYGFPDSLSFERTSTFAMTDLDLP